MLKNRMYKIKEKTKGKFAKDSIWLLIGQFFIAFFGIISSILVGNIYHKDGLGVFNQAIAFYLILSSISTIGLTASTVKFIAEDIKSKTQIISNHIVIVLILGSLISFVVLLVGKYFPYLFSSNDVASATLTAIIALPLYSVNKIFLAVLNGERKMKILAVFRTVRWILILILIFIISRFSLQVNDTLYALIFTEIIMLFLSIGLYYKDIRINYVNYIRIKKSLIFGSKNFLSEIVAYTQDKVDIIIVGYFLSQSEVGLYSLAVTFAKGLLIVPSVFMQNFNPIFSNLINENNISEILSYTKKIYKFSVFGMLFIVVLSIFGYLGIISVFFSNDYFSSFTLYLLMLLGVYIYSTVSWTGGFFIMAGKLEINLLRVSIIILSSIIINIVLTSQMGLLGAAISITVSLIFASIIQVVFIKKFLTINILNITFNEKRQRS